jgi:hypothetical protein
MNVMPPRLLASRESVDYALEAAEARRGHQLKDS